MASRLLGGEMTVNRWRHGGGGGGGGGERGVGHMFGNQMSSISIYLRKVGTRPYFLTLFKTIFVKEP